MITSNKTASRAIATQNSTLVAMPLNTANNQGEFVNSNKVIELFALPDTFVVTYANSNENGDVGKTCYFFNEDVFNACPVTNTAGTPVRTYSDGFSGKSYNALLRSAGLGRGVKFSSFNIDFTNASDTSDSAAFGTAAFNIFSYNAAGSSPIPVPINLSRAKRNNAQDTGLLTIVQDFWLNATSQISVYVPKGDTLVLTLNVAQDQN